MNGWPVWFDLFFGEQRRFDNGKALSLRAFFELLGHFGFHGFCPKFAVMGGGIVVIPDLSSSSDAKIGFLRLTMPG